MKLPNLFPNMKFLWTYGPFLKPILPGLKILLDRFGPENTKSILDAAVSIGSGVVDRVSRILSVKEQIGLKLLNLTSKQQEMVVQWKCEENIRCNESSQA